MPASERKAQSTLSVRSAPYSVSSLLRRSIESLKYVIGMPKFATPEVDEVEVRDAIAVDEVPAVISEDFVEAPAPLAPCEAPSSASVVHSAEIMPSDTCIIMKSAAGRSLTNAGTFARLGAPSEPLKPLPVRGPQPVSRKPLLALDVAKVISRMGRTKPSLPRLPFNCEKATYLVEESAFGKFIDTRCTHARKQAAAPAAISGAISSQSKTPAKADPLEYALRAGTPQPLIHSFQKAVCILSLPHLSSATAQ